MPTQRLKTPTSFKETTITILGETLTAREWNNGLIDVRINEAFARANGYSNFATMEADTINTQSFRNPWGDLPGWCRYVNGAFKFVMPK